MPRNLERAVMTHLTSGSGGERFALRRHAFGPLERALERDLREPDPLDSLNAVLRLTAALEERLSSPSVARALREVMKRSQEAVAILKRGHQSTRQVDEVRSFARREGRSVTVRAPIIDQPTPAGAVPLRALFTQKGRINVR